MKKEIFSIIITLALFYLSFVYLSLPLFTKIILIISILLFWVFSIFSYQKKFLNGILVYRTGYIIELCLLSLFLIYLVTKDYFPNYNSIYITIPFIVVFGIIFLVTGTIPYFKYRGLFLSSPKKFRVPRGERILDIFVNNSTPSDVTGNLEIKLPSNVILSDGKNYFKKDFFIRAKSNLPIRLKLKSIENRANLFTFFHINTNSDTKKSMRIEFIT